MSDNPEKIAELQSDKLVDILHSKNLGVPVCRHIETKGHNGQQFVKPEYVIETFPSVEFLKSIKILRPQIRTLVSIRTDLGVETSTVPYLETSAAAAASSSPSRTTTATLTAEEAEKLLQEAAPLFTSGKYCEAVALYSTVIDGISLNEDDASLKQILSRALSNRSGCFLSSKKSKEALVDGRRCVDVRPSWVRAHLRVASAAEELEEFDLAIAAYETAMKVEDRSGKVPSQEEIEKSIVSVQRKQFNNSAASSSKTTTTTTLTAEEAETLLQEAAPLFTTLKYFEAFALYSKIINGISLNEADASLKQILSRALSNRSGCFLGLKKSKEALVDARRCVDVRPSWVRAHLRVAAAAEELEEFDLAIAAYESAMKAADRTGKVPSNKELEAEILRVKQKNWKEVISETTNEFDKILSIETTTVASKTIQRFCQYLEEFMDKHSSSTRHKIAAREAFVWISKYCTNSDSAGYFCATVATLVYDDNSFDTNCNDDNRRLFGTAAVRDALLLVSKHSTTPDSAIDFCASILYLTTKNNKNKLVFGTAAVRDAFLLVSKYCTSTDSAEYLCGSIFNLIQNNDANQRLFATASVRDALLLVSKYIASPDSATKFCTAVSTLTCENDNNKILFGTAAVREAFLLVSKYCSDSDSAMWFCVSINDLVSNNDDNKILLGTAAVRDALVDVSKYCTTDDSAESFGTCIFALICDNDNNKKLFATEPIRRALNASAKHAPEIASLAFSQILFPK